jgi:hypothetical protein
MAMELGFANVETEGLVARKEVFNLHYLTTLSHPQQSSIHSSSFSAAHHQLNRC